MTANEISRAPQEELEVRWEELEETYWRELDLLSEMEKDIILSEIDLIETEIHLRSIGIDSTTADGSFDGEEEANEALAG